MVAHARAPSLAQPSPAPEIGVHVGYVHCHPADVLGTAAGGAHDRDRLLEGRLELGDELRVRDAAARNRRGLTRDEEDAPAGGREQSVTEPAWRAERGGIDGLEERHAPQSI